jgi:hypothetical protein
MSAEDFTALQSKIMPLLRAFRRIHDRAMVDAAFRGQFHLADWEETLLAPARKIAPDADTRLDFKRSPAPR